MTYYTADYAKSIIAPTGGTNNSTVASGHYSKHKLKFITSLAISIYTISICICKHIIPLHELLIQATVNVERFAGLNFHLFHGFQEYCKSFIKSKFVKQS